MGLKSKNNKQPETKRMCALKGAKPSQRRLSKALRDSEFEQWVRKAFEVLGKWDALRNYLFLRLHQ